MTTGSPASDQPDRGLADYHVHSTWSDDAESPLEDNLAVAAHRGLGTLCMVEHVRRSSAWVPEFVAAAEALRPRDDLRVLVGVETKILDVKGTLDMPADLAGLDHVLVADHQFPVGDRCCTPTEVRALLAGGTVTADELVTGLVDATAAAVTTCDHAILAHLFSILPKVGLDEADVPRRRWPTWPGPWPGPGPGSRSTRSGPVPRCGRSAISSPPTSRWC